MGRLKDKVALITGAAGGIGASSAELFAAQGAHVALVDVNARDGEMLDAKIRAAGHSSVFIPCDVREEASVKDAVAATLARYGTLDILVNVAGGSVAEDAPVHEVDMSLWDKTLSVDLLGTFLFCRHAVPPMMAARKGSIVNVSSWAGLKGFRKHIYTAAKGGVLSLTRSLAGEYARHGIRANVICPGGVRSERNLKRYAAVDAGESAAGAERRRVRETYPFSYGDPIDVANIILFLASDESRMITGATIAADGGRSAY